MKTLIVNYPVLNIGGIEQNVVRHMEYAHSQGYRVIWLARKPLTLHEGFKHLLKYVEIVYVYRGITGHWKCPQFKLDEKDKIVILSFTPFDMDNAIKIKNKYYDCNITPLYIVANTKGRYYFIEEYYFGILRKKIFKKMCKISQEWMDAGSIRFYTDLQKKAFEEHYKIENHKEDELLLPNVSKINPLNEEELKLRADRDKEFKIVTVSRFDFPHKNYLLFLIDDYAKLKKKYPHISLHIIGYGQGQSQVEKKIASLSTEQKEGIILYGSIAPNELPEILKKMNLNVSVAGSATVGARNGVLTLPARNFCENECQVYGFYHTSKDKVTSVEEGLPAIHFIEEAIMMDDEKYIEFSRLGYEKAKTSNYDPEYLYKQELNTKSDHSLRSKHCWMAGVYAFCGIAYKFQELFLNK